MTLLYRIVVIDLVTHAESRGGLIAVKGDGFSRRTDRLADASCPASAVCPRTGHDLGFRPERADAGRVEAELFDLAGAPR
jgi:hypothetical protein